MVRKSNLAEKTMTSQSTATGLVPFFLASILALLSGCNSSGGSGDESDTFQYRSQLQSFDHCGELESYLLETAEKQQSLYDYSLTQPTPILTPEPGVGLVDSDGIPVIGEVTGTNNQVAGVDEADFVKTSGDYTYLLSGGYLVILKTWPAADSVEISRTLLDGNPRALFVHGDVVWIVSSLTEAQYLQLGENVLAADFAPRIEELVKISLFDIGNPQQPELLRETTVESRYSDARKIGSHVYLVLSAYLDLSPMLSNTEEIEVTELLPVMTDDPTPSQGDPAASTLISECEAIYRPETANGTGTVSILGFDLENPASEISRQTIVSNTGMVYATQEHLYLATVEDQVWVWLPVIEGGDYPEVGTSIHKFNLQPTPQYVASGRVDGHLLNQFAMDEHQGVLRVVTTAENWWEDADPENRLFILEQAGGELIERSRLEGLGKPGDRLYAARFLEDKGFLVTFRQIDPFYTLDLSDSYDPRVAGELEVPGFSTYLHPIDETLILAIGRDIDQGGIKLSLFDIGAFEQPVLLSDHLVGAGSYSEAEYNHHAFTWFAGADMLAIPLSRWNLSDPTLGGSLEAFVGLELFEVTRSQGIQAYAAIDHTLFYDDENAPSWHYLDRIRRSFFVADEEANSYLYSVSSLGLLVNDLADPETDLVGIPLPYDSPIYPNW